MRKRLNLLREFSIPLIAGVVTALVWANLWPASYHHFDHTPWFGGMSFHFMTNDLFMALFFAIAAVEITQSCLPGGDLNPPRKAINPLLATLGGVLGPVLLYVLLNSLVGGGEFVRGWGIPTATDIALAWLVARIVFGANHPVIPFLLLLAIADDAIGLVIIALFYPDPGQPVLPLWLLLTLVGMLVALFLRRAKVESYWPYLLLGGVPSWFGLHLAHLHPALALVFVVPFLPHPPREELHLFEGDPADRSPMSRFEHEWKVVVDFGLFFFGLANAGVPFSALGTATWLVLGSLIVGKTVGVFSLAMLANRCGFPLPSGMGWRELLVAGIIAGIGFTVAIFVAGEAFTDPAVQGAAKMGAMLSIGGALIAVLLARWMRLPRRG